jgi:colanic acid/amylovoran biosynthesis glycosyltransferase
MLNTHNIADAQAGGDRTLRVLHAFNKYLAPSENWAYNLMRNTPNTKCIVAARQLLTTNFFDPETLYIPFPLSGPVPNPGNSTGLRIYNHFQQRLSRYYPWVLARMVNDVDIIHAHFGTVGYFYRDLRKLLDRPLAVSYYGVDYEYTPYVNPAWGQKYRELFDTADCFICEGTHGASVLERIGCPTAKIALNRLGVQVEDIPVHKRIKKPGELRLVQIASITDKKGQVDTLEAFIAAHAKCPNITLTFVGGPRRPRDEDTIALLRRRALEAGVSERVTLLPRIDYSRLYEFLRGFHVFIHPSTYTLDRDCEGGAPVVLLDAQATGMPVIATTHCDIPEEVRDGLTGFLAPERDVTALAKHIETFYGMDTETYLSFSDRARQHIAQNYAANKNGATLRSLYDSVIEQYCAATRR